MRVAASNLTLFRIPPLTAATGNSLAVKTLFCHNCIDLKPLCINMHATVSSRREMRRGRLKNEELASVGGSEGNFVQRFDPF